MSQETINITSTAYMESLWVCLELVERKGREREIKIQQIYYIVWFEMQEKIKLQNKALSTKKFTHLPSQLFSSFVHFQKVPNRV